MINPGLTDYGGIVSCNSAIAASFAVFFTKKLLIESRKLREQDLIKYKSSIRPFFLSRHFWRLFFFYLVAVHKKQ